MGTMMRIFKYNNKCIKFKLNLSFFLKTFTKKHLFCHNMAAELMKVDLTDHLVSPKQKQKHFT